MRATICLKRNRVKWLRTRHAPAFLRLPCPGAWHHTRWSRAHEGRRHSQRSLITEGNRIGAAEGATILDRQDGYELLRARLLVVARVHELDRGPVDVIEDRHVRGRADGEGAESGHASDDLRRLDGRALHDLFQRQA